MIECLQNGFFHDSRVFFRWSYELDAAGKLINSSIKLIRRARNFFSVIHLMLVQCLPHAGDDGRVCCLVSAPAGLLPHQHRVATESVNLMHEQCLRAAGYLLATWI